jgi:hypothetical protein
MQKGKEILPVKKKTQLVKTNQKLAQAKKLRQGYKSIYYDKNNV